MNLFSCILLIKLNIVLHIHGAQETLLDTRKALSDLGFHIKQSSKWEETSMERGGEAVRGFIVCQVRDKKNDNWIRSQYVNVKEARRVSVEIEFVMRSCDGVKNVASCKETFNLYYFESDRDIATSTHPPWSENAYIKVDTIAADKRWNANNKKSQDLINLEVRSIGPLTKKGIYIAIQDLGSCISVNYIRVFYDYCDVTLSNLALFTRTTTGSSLTSLVETTGKCVINSVIKDSYTQPSLYCDGKGNWTMSQGSCYCKAGFEPDNKMTNCSPCRKGTYKPTISNNLCVRCPQYSIAKSTGMSKCTCMSNFFRSNNLQFKTPCSKPPGPPVSLKYLVNGSMSIISWTKPLYVEEDYNLYYNISCEECDTDDFCKKCYDVFYSNSTNIVFNTKIKLINLKPKTKYKIKVSSINDITKVAFLNNTKLKNSREISFMTKQRAPAVIINLIGVDVTDTSLSVIWSASSDDQINGYEVLLTKNDSFVPQARKFTNTNKKVSFSGLQPKTQYFIKVRAKMNTGFGPFAEALSIKTSKRKAGHSYQENTIGLSSKNFSDFTIYLFVSGGVLLVLIIGVMTAVFTYKKARPRKLDNLNQTNKQKSNNSFFDKNAIVVNQRLTTNDERCLSSSKAYSESVNYEDPQVMQGSFTEDFSIKNISGLKRDIKKKYFSESKPAGSSNLKYSSSIEFIYLPKLHNTTKSLSKEDKKHSNDVTQPLMDNRIDYDVTRPPTYCESFYLEEPI